jgi:protein-disulfide isomerase
MNNNENTLAEPVGTKDHAQGPAGAPVTLVEYGDYECPYCGEAYPVLKEVKERMGDTLHFVFRNFPLSEMHPHAFAAALAAEAAGAQGKFWEMHDVLFENQRALGSQALLGYAEAAGLDVKQFLKDMNAETYSARVKHDFQTGLMSGVNGTPTLFINGERYDGGRDTETLLDVLQEIASQNTIGKKAARR